MQQISLFDTANSHEGGQNRDMVKITLSPQYYQREFYPNTIRVNTNWKPNLILLHKKISRNLRSLLTHSVNKERYDVNFVYNLLITTSGANLGNNTYSIYILTKYSSLGAPRARLPRQKYPFGHHFFCFKNWRLDIFFCQAHLDRRHRGFMCKRLARIGIISSSWFLVCIYI